MVVYTYLSGHNLHNTPNCFEDQLMAMGKE